MLESFFKNVTGLTASNFIKKRLQHRCFPVNIAKFLRTASCINTSGGCFSISKNVIINYVEIKILGCLLTNAISKRTILTKFWNLNMLPKDAKRSGNHLTWSECTSFTSRKNQGSCFQMMLRKVIKRIYNLLKVMN